jgi:hypothetical protein
MAAEADVLQMLDIRGGVVQVEVKAQDGKAHTIWVNVDGICRLRIQNPEHYQYNRSSSTVKADPK